MTVRGIVRAQKAAPEAFAEKGDYKVCYFTILRHGNTDQNRT